MAEFPSRIVCVEDEFEISDLIKASLEISGEDFFFVTCGSGDEIIKRFNVLQPDFMILDLSLPDMTGPDVLQAVRSLMIEFGTRVMVVTGHDQVVMTEDYRRLGVMGVVHKPFVPQELLDRVVEYYQMPLNEAFVGE